MKILYEDNNIVACVKAAGLSSEDDVPKELSSQLNSEIYPLHRLDTPVGGVMVYAKTKSAAAKFSKKIADNTDFTKTYVTVCEGVFEEQSGTMEDLLFKERTKALL